VQVKKFCTSFFVCASEIRLGRYSMLSVWRIVLSITCTPLSVVHIQIMKSRMRKCLRTLVLGDEWTNGAHDQGPLSNLIVCMDLFSRLMHIPIALPATSRIISVAYISLFFGLIKMIASSLVPLNAISQNKCTKITPNLSKDAITSKQM